MIRIELVRSSGDYGFDVTDAMNHRLQTDSSRTGGGGDNGFRPMQLILAALGSCSAIDIVSILKKQHQEINGFSIVVEGEREENKTPSLWKSVQIHFVLQGNVDEEKASRAVRLSVEKYCSVAETLRRGGANISWTLSVEPGKTKPK